MHCGSPWSKAFLDQISDKKVRDAYVADRLRTRVANMIRALREQRDRGWTQADLGQQMGKPQSVVSRLEDPDYGRLTVQSLLDVASAFDLPLMIDFPEWGDWMRTMSAGSAKDFERCSFDALALSDENPSTNEVHLAVGEPAGPEHVDRLDPSKINALATFNRWASAASNIASLTSCAFQASSAFPGGTLLVVGGIPTAAPCVPNGPCLRLRLICRRRAFLATSKQIRASQCLLNLLWLFR